MSKSRSRRTAPTFKRPDKQLRRLRAEVRRTAAVLCCCSHYDTEHVGTDQCTSGSCRCRQYRRAPITVDVAWK